MLPAWLLEGIPSVSVFAVLGSATFVGCLMRGFAGFGAGLLMAPVFSLLMSPTDVVVIVLLVNLLTTFQMLPGALRSVDWTLVLRLFIPSLLGLPIGLAMLHYVDPSIMRKLVAVVVTIVALLMLAGWYYRGRRGRLQDVLTGTLSGFMTAIGGIGGPPIILYLLSIPNLSPTVLRAVSLIFFSLAQIVTLIPLAMTSAVTGQQLIYVFTLLPLAIIASAAGGILHVWSMGKHQNRVRQASLLILLGTGLVAFFL